MIEQIKMGKPGEEVEGWVALDEIKNQGVFAFYDKVTKKITCNEVWRGIKKNKQGKKITGIHQAHDKRYYRNINFSPEIEPEVREAIKRVAAGTIKRDEIDELLKKGYMV